MDEEVRDLFGESSFVYKEPGDLETYNPVAEDAWSVDLTQDFYIYDGLGFPVVLCNPIMVKLREKFVPDIDFNKLMDQLYAYLETRESLSKEHQEFIRKYKGMKRETD
jgi:hypothetical protein